MKKLAKGMKAVARKFDVLPAELETTLVNAISDPLVLKQKEFLTPKQAKVIDSFLADKKLPEEGGKFFVDSIQAILKNYHPVVIDAEALLTHLEQLPPMDEATFKASLNDLIAKYTKGKDASPLRIVVKRKER